MASDFELETEKKDVQNQIDELGTTVMDKAIEFDAQYQIGTKKGKEKEREKAMTANAYVRFEIERHDYYEGFVSRVKGGGSL